MSHGNFNEEQSFMNVKENHYLNARMEWQNMFHDLTKAKQNWQRLCYGLLLLCVLAVIAIMMLSKKNQYIPYVVKVDELGLAQFVTLPKQGIAISSQQYQAFLSQYIRQMRSVIADPIAQKQALDFIYASTTQAAMTVINHYYREHDPFELAKDYTKEIKVRSILQHSSQTWQIEWLEITRDLQGQEIQQQAFSALITLMQQQSDDVQRLMLNPLQLYVKTFHFTQQQT